MGTRQRAAAASIGRAGASAARAGRPGDPVLKHLRLAGGGARVPAARGGGDRGGALRGGGPADPAPLDLQA
eukprot:231372-Chlamydomonas_euryale.AAC.1